jgi:hypothetical protein
MTISTEFEYKGLCEIQEREVRSMVEAPTGVRRSTKAGGVRGSN